MEIHLLLACSRITFIWGSFQTIKAFSKHRQLRRTWKWIWKGIIINFLELFEHILRVVLFYLSIWCLVFNFIGVFEIKPIHNLGFIYKTFSYFIVTCSNLQFFVRTGQSVTVVWSEKFFDVYYMSVGQKLMILKICPTIVTLMILGNLKAAPEETMQLRGLIKRSNWRLGHYLVWRYEFWKFWPPIAQIPFDSDVEFFQKLKGISHSKGNASRMLETRAECLT